MYENIEMLDTWHRFVSTITRRKKRREKVLLANILAKLKSQIMDQ